VPRDLNYAALLPPRIWRGRTIEEEKRIEVYFAVCFAAEESQYL